MQRFSSFNRLARRGYSTQDQIRYTHVFSPRWDPLAFIGIGIVTYLFLYEPKEHNDETGKPKWITMAKRAWERYGMDEEARIKQLEESLKHQEHVRKIVAEAKAIQFADIAPRPNISLEQEERELHLQVETIMKMLEEKNPR